MSSLLLLHLSLHKCLLYAFLNSIRIRNNVGMPPKSEDENNCGIVGEAHYQVGDVSVVLSRSLQALC